ncbi:hypothetical protein FXE80_01245 [Vibrio cholerae]|uniref:hypothetical protein n=1 Tax=Vibrio cholerae TaxID=666 RepID=UPI000E68EA68|nr:hypothetical protein [Vibrio cholerae]EJL6679749.1 hypothetical protein [Vibrio cholerae]TXY78011.1 hypothetical protein FXE80_01245 [Vibrio cholerae]GIB16867.1 hypothetical protein VCSRO90_2836 [Vibrio cholerae]
MKTKVTLFDGQEVSIESIHTNVMRTGDTYDNKINKILAKYDSNWIDNEHDVDPAKMSDEDYKLYNELFEMRASIEHISSQLCVLL